jgi:hypothetical protein
MENYRIETDITAFGKEVKTFPQGIKQAFDELLALFPKDDPRPFYGISLCTDKGIVYYAAAHETYEGEAEALHCERYTIEKGNYLAVTVTDWLTKTDTIKDVFDNMFRDDRSDRDKPCIEIYKNDWEMICLVKEREPVEETALNRDALVHEFDKTTDELFALLHAFGSAEINASFAEHSWSAAQVGEHLFKSDSAVLRMLNGDTADAGRSVYLKVAGLKQMFLDFTTKLESPRFVRPLRRTYDKDTILQQLETTRSSLRQAILTLDLDKLCTTVEEPALAGSTRTELLHFMLYHTMRHNNQLKKIYQQVTTDALPRAAN